MYMNHYTSMLYRNPLPPPFSLSQSLSHSRLLVLHPESAVLAAGHRRLGALLAPRVADTSDPIVARDARVRLCTIRIVRACSFVRLRAQWLFATVVSVLACVLLLSSPA